MDKEIKEIREKLYDDLKRGKDIFGCEPSCRRDDEYEYNCEKCIEEHIEYLKNIKERDS